MLAYAAYRRPQNIELHSIWQKKTKTCVCAIVKSVRWYFGTPLPLRGGFPPNVTFAACSLYANISELINTELHSYTIMPKSALLCEHNAHYYL